ncbi:MAG: DHHA1 domain-containing protein [Candidatus Nanoarchaeia archaeon]|nr:DHHA1 domain-containing protein [Candidatus Nanoarchaeia archaeon]
MNLKDAIFEAKKIALVFDLDADGVCSAKIAYEALNRMQKNVEDFFPSPSGNLNDDSLINGIKNANPDLLIIVDDELRKDSKIAKSFDFKIVVIDHHSIQDLPVKKNIHYFNPKINGDDSYIPASKYCFDLFSKFVDVEDLDWVAAIGIISDSGAPQHLEFLKKVFKKYSFNAGKDAEYFSDSFLAHLGEIINSGKVVKGNEGALKAFFALRDSADSKDFLQKSYELRQWHEQVNEYLQKVLEEFDLKKEAYNNLGLYFYSFNPKYKIGSILSNIASFKHPDKTVVIFSKKPRMVSVSYRRQDKKFDMNALARKSIKGLSGAGGGGHVPAAGGHVRAKDLNMLKRNIVRALKEAMEKNE